MDQQTKVNIIAAAFAAAGPLVLDPDMGADEVREAREAHKALIGEQISEIAVVATDEKSWANRTIDQVVGPDVKTIMGTVMKVSKDKRNTRGKVLLKREVHPEYAPDGTEEVNTERTDRADGLLMARKLRSLKGHRVLLRAEVEKFQTKSGATRKMRVVRHCTDLGPDRDLTEEDE